MRDIKQLMTQLKELFPDDERLRNAVLMAVGVGDQLPILNKALQDQLLDLPKTGESTVEWENLTYLAVTDCIQWAARLELSLHDMRQAFFFRYNNRVKDRGPTPEEIEAAMEAKRIKTNKEIAREEAEKEAPAAPVEAETTGDPDPPRPRPVGSPAKNISSLFGNLKK